MVGNVSVKIAIAQKMVQGMLETIICILPALICMGFTIQALMRSNLFRITYFTHKQQC